jgi:hypothetical protein
LKHSEGSDRADHQVILNDILGLNTVLDEDVVALHPKTDVFLHQKVVSAVDCKHTGERVMN